MGYPIVIRIVAGLGTTAVLADAFPVTFFSHPSRIPRGGFFIKTFSLKSDFNGRGVCVLKI